ncbi:MULTISPECIES: hypothetical protein [Nostoc]|uniref:Uncharacterized protein n=1 Tax=Nostoc paludosum FACHB-159 TaxID=2692908 RepID=A0ABR8KJ85_9NOSO|nr:MULTISPECIES: hypothetical protein [Nostoc]MBD2681923.1 hypothetical protein [Nostoc sp. FACHB-857]MBD2738248.1 hypothetical protein [Nostoc paludosum FACHB-159]
MHYLYDVQLWDRIETGVEFLIFVALMIAAIIKLGHNDFLQALFYIVLAVIISPWSGFERVTKRYILVSVFFLGLFVGYFS